MKATIKYCKPCGYLKRAQQLAQRLETERDAEVTLVPGTVGVFKIWVDDRLVFDKRSQPGLLAKLGFGPIPSDDELLRRIPARDTADA